MSFYPRLRDKGEGEPSPPSDKGKFALLQWVGVSGFLHSVIIVSFLLIPHTPFSRTISYPVYTVELVGGEKLGGGTPPVAIKAPPVKKKRAVKVKPKRVKVRKRINKETPHRHTKVKRLKRLTPPRVALAKKPAVIEKVKKATKKAPQTHEQVGLQGTLEAEVRKEVKKEEQPQEGLSDQVREKLIHAALERVKRRARIKPAEQEPSNGVENSEPGEGQGAVAPGQGGRGGGILKGIEFLVYRNRMLNLIKERWAWVGKNTELEVKVRFGVLENGDIVGLKIVDESGDPSYDDSVLRAMRKSAPLPPPPDNYRKDFLNVELTFRPKDLRG